MVKYPDIHVELGDGDGNAFIIIGKIVKALRKANVPPEKIAAFKTEAQSSDYDHLLQTAMAWVDVG